MLITALRTLRARWVTFVGSFTALALGVALLTVTGLALASSLDVPDRAPQRLASAPVVVQGQDTLRVPTPVGDRVHRLAHPRPVPAHTIARLKRLGPVAEDRAFPVRAADGTRLTGRPWSIAAFAPYDLTAGRAPKAPHEAVATSPGVRPGDRLRTATASSTSSAPPSPGPPRARPPSSSPTPAPPPSARPRPPGSSWTPPRPRSARPSRTPPGYRSSPVPPAASPTPARTATPRPSPR
ncbi:hypothetical protein ACFWHW_05745 [Streptomyces pharetrae]|uniref:hypothetical protein n=1 Tax=Streptomyces pharetrae TaxID=291370 RepID=UPI00364D03EB